MHLENFLKMLDSQRIRYKRYDNKHTIEIAIPCLTGYSCYDFDLQGNFESIWDRNFEYPEDFED